jgi:hypothetical protein
MGWSTTLLAVLLLASISMSLMACTRRSASKPGDATPSASLATGSSESSSAAQLPALPASAYRLQSDLPSWVDTQTGYDVSRDWKLDGGKWPVAMLMSPSQSPQALVGFQDGEFRKALKPFGITPVLEKIDLPPRTFHAMQRSKWPFVYMPLAVFTDYSRSQQNQGGAGGLQYVALAGSTAGGGYTLMAWDPQIKSVKDLADKTVAQVNSNPVPATLLAAAAKQAGVSVGDGPGQIHFARSSNDDQLNGYMAHKLDAVISLNILKGQLLAQGSHVVTDFAGVPYTPNYTILAVERSVLEQKPEVVKAFLEAHYAANKLAEKEWNGGMKAALMNSWNDYFKTQKVPSAKQRIVPNQAAFDSLLGNMYPEQRIDPKFLADQWTMVSSNALWGWAGKVDTAKLADLKLYDQILASHGQEPQSSASKR